MVIKDDIVSQVSRQTRYSKFMVGTVVDALLNNITQKLAHGESVQFLGFGTFEPKRYAERTGRNPHTNEEVKIPSRIIPVFRAGKTLRKAVVKVCK